MATNMLIPLSETSFALFPWVGTRTFRTLRRYLGANAAAFGISGMESEGCCYITGKVKPGAFSGLMEAICRKMKEEGIQPERLIGAGEYPAFDKYDQYIPAALLREAYATDRLDPAALLRDVAEQGGKMPGR